MNYHLILGAQTSEPLKLKNFSDLDIVIGVDRGALTILANHYPLHLAVGDFDSVSEQEFEKIVAKAGEVRTYAPEKDLTDSEIALQWTASQKKPSDQIYIYHWLAEGRIDHFLSHVWWTLNPKYHSFIEDCHFISLKNEWSVLMPGHHSIPKVKQFPYVSLITLTEIKNLTLEGFKYPLDQYSSQHPEAWISNELLTQSGNIYFDFGKILLIYTRD